MVVEGEERRSYTGDGLVGLNETTTILEKPVDRPGVDPGTHRMRPEQGESQSGSHMSQVLFAPAAFSLAVNNVAKVRLCRRTYMGLAQLK
jgi:hypothetical protein